VLPDDPEEKDHIKNRHKRVWEDAPYLFRHGVPIHEHFWVTLLCEPAVDTGGPLREFLHLMMSSITCNTPYLWEISTDVLHYTTWLS